MSVISEHKRSIRALMVSILAAIFLYGAVLVGSDSGELSEAFTRVTLEVWGLILGLSLFNYALRYWRWDWMILKQIPANETRIPHHCHLIIYLAGFAFTTTPGKMGEALRSLYLHRFNISTGLSLGALLIERILDLLTVALLAWLLVYALPGYEFWPTLVMTIAALFIVLVSLAPGRAWLRRQSERLQTRFPGKDQGILQRLWQAMEQIGSTSRSLLAPKPLVFGLFLGLIAWGAEAWGLFLVTDALSIDIHWAAVMGIYSISVIIGALSFVPGGLGTTEASMALLLVGMGADPTDAAVATLVCRVATLWFAVILGFIAVLAIETRRSGSSCAP